jgi:hypothetical protein
MRLGGLAQNEEIIRLPFDPNAMGKAREPFSRNAGGTIVRAGQLAEDRAGGGGIVTEVHGEEGAVFE